MPPISNFLTRNLNLAWDDDPDAELGGGDDPVEPEAEPEEAERLDDGLDDLFGDQDADPAADPAADDGNTSTRNPAVLAVLDQVREVLPKGLHSLIIDDLLAPELTKTQQGIDQQMAAMQPWRDFSKNGVSPEDAQNALRIAQFIVDNPDQALVDVARLVQSRGLNPAELLGIQIAQQASAPSQDADAALRSILGADGEGVDLEDNPALKAVLQKLAAIEQGQQSQQQLQERARAQMEQQQVATAMQQVKDGFAARGVTLNEKAVLQYTLAHVDSLPEAQRQALDPFEALKLGAKQWLDDVRANAAPARRAPRIGGSRGGIGAAGVPAPPPPPQTLEEKKAAFLAKAAAGTFGGVG